MKSFLAFVSPILKDKIREEKMIKLFITLPVGRAEHDLRIDSGVNDKYHDTDSRDREWTGSHHPSLSMSLSLLP